MRIQIASDLHLESRPKSTFREILEPAVAPILALLGDLAPLNHPNLRPLLEWCSENWETVIWIPGCLELLGPGSGNEGLGEPDLVTPVARMKAIAAPYWNVSVLDHEGMVSTDGVYLFGLPFWKFPRDDGHVWHPQFYRYVEAEPSQMDGDFQRAAYNADIKWLRQQTKATKEPMVILSHTGPTTWVQEEGFVGDPDRSVVLPEIEELLRAPIVAWLCGHCHHSVQAEKGWADATGEKGSVFIAANPRGQPLENLDYRVDAVVRIDPNLYYRDQRDEL
jgi:hypothetical protein